MIFNLSLFYRCREMNRHRSDYRSKICSVSGQEAKEQSTCVSGKRRRHPEGGAWLLEKQRADKAAAGSLEKTSDLVGTTMTWH